MRTAIAFAIEPLEGALPEVLDEIYDELWDLNLANIRHLVIAIGQTQIPL